MSTFSNNIFSILDNICKNLTAPEHSDLNNQVQAKVNDWQLYMRYMEVIPSLISLYLGPISGNWFIVLLYLVTFYPHNRCWEEACDVHSLLGSHHLRQPIDRQCLHGGLGPQIPFSRASIYHFRGIHAPKYCNVGLV